MKKLIFTLSILFTAIFAQAQVGCFWHEDFDPTSLDDSVVSSVSGTTNPGWDLNQRLFVTSPNSDSAYIGMGDTVILTTTPVMDLTAFTYVLLDFDQICKISFFDKAILEYSYDGTNWIKMEDDANNSNVTYLGSAPFFFQLSSFSTASYGVWYPGSPDSIPTNAWWQHESFDISAIAGGIPTFQFRFRMWDEFADLTDTLNGWHLDNICVTAAPCELQAPEVFQLAPIWNNITYTLGPFDVNDSTIDAISGIQNSWLIYTINGGTPDTIDMTTPVDIYHYTGQIPAVNSGDTVCYYITVMDASGCSNVASTTQHCFVASAGISFPYCLETFDASVLWSDTTVTGSSWELGTPAWGATTGALSPPNAWDVELSAPYQTNTECYLYSPVFNFSPQTANARITFWQNRNTSQQEDGVTLQYSLNGPAGPWTTLGDVNNTCGCSVNWYTDISFNSGLPEWSGSSNGWIKSDFIFDNTYISPQFMLRFEFRSSTFTTGDGFSIDDFCFTLPEADDPGIANIVSPVGNAPEGSCLPVTVTIHNYGSNTITTSDVYYTYDGSLMGPFTWSGSLDPGEEEPFTMPCDTIAPGQNDICAWVVLAGDVNHFNDTSCATMFGIPTIILDSLNPYCDNFDTLTSIWYSELMPGGQISTNWEHGAPNFGCVNSPHTAPNAWGVNLNTGYQNTANVALYSPYFDIQNAFNPYLDFWINRNTELNWDGVRMEYHSDIMPANQWDIVQPLDTINWYNMQTPNSIICSGLPAWAGNPCSGWTHVHAGDLTPLVNLAGADFVQFRFVFCSDGSVLYDGFLIDDFCFKMPAPFDAGVSVILQPAFSAPADSCEPVEVTIKNFGYNPLTNVNVYYSKDDIPYGNPVTYGPFLWTGGPLAPGASIDWILPVCDTVPPGAYNFCAWTELVLPQVDGDNTNDTSCTQGIGIPTIPLSYTNSYCDDFNGPNVGWSVQNIVAGGQWELGPPAFGTTNSAYSPPNAWDINLNSPYQGLSESMLYSPFFDFNQAANPVMSFWVNFNTFLSWDGVRCEFSLNGGPWTVLFSQGFGDLNWYNSVACSNAAWSGNSSTALINPTVNGWAQVIDTLPLSPFSSFPGIVQFRFHWCSGNQFPFPTDGFSIDDFCLVVPVPLTAQPTTCHNTSNPPFIFPGQPISFDTDVRNAGTTPLSSVVTQVLIDNVAIASDTIIYSPPLPYNGSANHVFSSTWVTAPGVHNVCMVTSYPNSGVDLNPTDDTLCCSLSVIDTVSVGGGPYCPDFDSAPQWVTLNAFPPYAPNSSWNFGAPNVGFMTAAHTGTNAWKIGSLTGPNGNYPNKDSSALFTPAFNIQVGRTYDLSFWHEYAFEAYQDGGNVEYSTDFGGSWNVLGTGGLATWYDSYFVTALGGTPPQPGWSIASQVWTNPHHTICFQQQNGQLAYPVMFRFRFGSDYSVNNLGWLIDDFCFQDIGPCAVGVDEMPSASGLMLGQNHPNPANGLTSIDYIIPENGNVVLNIVNLLGQTIDTPVEAEQSSGKHTVSFDTDKLSPGIYYYSLTFNKETLVKKMVITK